MSAPLSIFPRFRIEPDDSDPRVWIRTASESVSITFDSAEQIAAMRAALDAVEQRLHWEELAA